MIDVHVANDSGKEDSILGHVLLWDPNHFFGYACAQSLEHALLGDMQGRPCDSSDLLCVDATPGVLALGVEYYEQSFPPIACAPWARGSGSCEP